MIKYELIPEEGTDLLRLKALRNFKDVKAGDLGGLISKESNLSHEGDCWVYGNARVYGDARVGGNAHVYNNAQVFDTARISGDAIVRDNTRATKRVINITGLPEHNITVTDNHITIGCKTHTIIHWVMNYKEIGKSSNYSPEEIEVYGDYIKSIAKQRLRIHR